MALDNQGPTADMPRQQHEMATNDGRIPNDSIYNSPIGSQSAIDAMKGAGSAGPAKSETSDLTLVDNGKVVAGGAQAAEDRTAGPVGAKWSDGPKLEAAAHAPSELNWFERQERLAGEISGAVRSHISDVESTVSKTASDIVHGKATLGEVGFAVAEAGALVGGGAAAVGVVGLLAGVELPAAGVVALGGAGVAAVGEAMTIWDSYKSP